MEGKVEIMKSRKRQRLQYVNEVIKYVWLYIS